MYCRYFGLSEDPFQLTPDPQFLFLDEIYREAMAHLEYGVTAGRGFILLTGEVGTGKTTLVHSFLDRFHERFDTAFIFSTAMNFVELLKLIHEDLGTGATGDSEAFLLIELNRYLLKQYKNERKTVLILDEAQNLPPHLLEKIRMLSNLEARKSKLIQIVLVGQPELAALLERKDLRQLRQRVAVRFDLPPMSGARTEEYIRHRLYVAGWSEGELFTAGALEKIHGASDGIPRLINVICSNALLLGLGEDTKVIDERLIDEVVRDLDRGVVVPADASSDEARLLAGTQPAVARSHGGGRDETSGASFPAVGVGDGPLTADEAAAYMRISTKTARALFRKGAIPASKIGRGWRVFRSDLDEYIRSGGTGGEERTAGEEIPGGAGIEAPPSAEAIAPAGLAEAIEKKWASARDAYRCAGDEHGEYDESSCHGGSGLYRESHGEGTPSEGIRSTHRG